MDQQLLFLINRSWTHPVLDWIMAVATNFNFWWPLLLLGALVALVFGGFRWRVFLLATGLAVGLTDAIVVDSLKDVVGRARPHDSQAGVRSLEMARATPRFLALGKPLRENISQTRIRSPHGNSFPSGHAANNFAVAGVALVFFRRWGWLVFIPAAIVAYSRVYVGSHWPLDVLVSALIGTGLAILTVAAMDAIWKWRGARLFPRLVERHPSLLTP